MQSPCTSLTSGMGISFKMGKGSVCGVYTSLKPMIHFDSKQSQSIFNQNYYKNAMANNCKQRSIRIISHTTTPPPKAYDCVAVYIAGRRTSLVVYGWWPQPPTKNAQKSRPTNLDCDETLTRCVALPTRCIYQVSKWYIKTCTKEVRKTFRWLGALLTSRFQMFLSAR